MYKKRIISLLLLLSMMLLTVPVNAETVSSEQQNVEIAEEVTQETSDLDVDEETTKQLETNGTIFQEDINWGTTSENTAIEVNEHIELFYTTVLIPCERLIYIAEGTRLYDWPNGAAYSTYYDDYVATVTGAGVFRSYGFCYAGYDYSGTVEVNDRKIYKIVGSNGTEYYAADNGSICYSDTIYHTYGSAASSHPHYKECECGAETSTYNSSCYSCNPGTIKYNANGGSGAPSNKTAYSSYPTISSTKPTRFKYKFLGWSTSSSASSASYVPGDTVYVGTGATKTLYAVWETYKTLETESQTTSNTNISVEGTIGYFRFKPTVSATYVFESTNSSGNPRAYLYDSSGDQLTSNNNSGEGSNTDNFKISYNLTAGNTYYYGVKWYGSSTTGKIYVKLRRQYNINFDANGGSNAPSIQTKLYGDTLTLSSTIPTRTGYTFVGWNTSSDATTASYTSGAAYSLNADNTLYAIWKAEGTCGDNCTWFLDNTGTLTISGTGDMTNFTNASSVPWSSIRSDIKKIIVSEGVTSIGNNCFNLCTAATTISLPSTLTSVGESSFAYAPITSLSLQEGVTSIGNSAFEGCSKLTSIVLPSTLKQIGSSAFINCSLLNNVGIPSGVTAINDYCFAECSALKNITIPLSVTEIKDYAFCMTSVETISYGGSPTHWTRIAIGTENTSLSSAAKTYGVNDFTVTYAVTTNGAGSADKTTDKIPNGEKADLTVVAKRAPIMGGGTVGTEKDVPWEFLGWNTDQNATVALEEVIVTSDVTLYPIFKKELTYNFYHANNELLESKTITIYNADNAAKFTMPSIETYLDWEPVEWCNDEFYSEMSDPVRMFDINAEVGLQFSSDFYARYKRTTTVSYDSGDYSETFEPDTFTQYYYGSGQKTGYTVFMPEILPLPVGEPLFYGWAENSADGDVLQSGDGMTARKDTTMYALWQERTTMPTISVSEVDGFKTVSMSCSMDGTSIYYTTDGTRATTESNAYTEPLTITGNEDISFKAIAVKDGYAYSKPVTKEVALNKLSAPVSNVLPGYVAANTVVKLSVPDGCGTIYYTTDGSIPTSESTAYTAPITVTGDTAIRAVTIKDGMKNSDVVLFNYMMVDEDKPYIGISSELNADNTAVTVKVNITANSKSTGGRFNLVYDNSQLQVASSSSGAYIAGTTNYIHEAYADNIVRVVWAGTKELNDAGEIMSVTFNIIGDEKETLMYIDGAKLSDTSGAKFDVQAASTMIKLYQEIIPTTAITLDKENLNLIVGQTATLTATVSPDNATNKAVVWSSSNENVATVSNGIVTAVAAGETTITVRQENNELNDTCTVIVTEPVQKEKVLTPTASKDSGSVQGGTTIELSTGTANATIYYTTDGSVPNASKTKYTGAITITEDTVIKAIAVKDGYDDSDIATFSYTVLNENAPTVYVSEVTGSAGSEVVVTLHIKNNPGVLGMMLQLSYDPALTLTALEQSTGESDSALETLDFTPGKNLTANPINIAWDGVEADETNGKILNMYFTIPEGAENGATYDIELSYEDGDVYDNDYNDIELTVANGTITIKNFTLGDINDDGKINMKDVTMLRRGVVGGYGITLNEAADVNCDGKTNMKDVTILRRYVVGGYGVTLG